MAAQEFREVCRIAGMHGDVGIAETDMDLQGNGKVAGELGARPQAEAHDIDILEAHLSGPVDHPIPGIRAVLHLDNRRRSLIDREGRPIGGDGLEADGTFGAAGQRVTERLRKARSLNAAPRHFLGDRLDSDDFVGRPSGEIRHRRHIGNRIAPVARVDDEPLQTTGSEQAPVDLPGTELATALDIGLTTGEGLEVRQGRTLAKDHEAERLVELGGALRRRPAALAHQRLEGSRVEIARCHPVAVVVDQRQITGNALNRHGRFSRTTRLRSFRRHARPRDT